MKRLASALIFAVLLCTLAAAQKQDKNQPQLRSLQGDVTGKEDVPLDGAVVYLKNTKTLAVRTYISGAEGKYQFNALSPNVDYEVYAEYQGQKSDTKTLSSFDSRAKAYINLRVPVPKKQ